MDLHIDLGMALISSLMYSFSSEVVLSFLTYTFRLQIAPEKKIWGAQGRLGGAIQKTLVLLMLRLNSNCHDHYFLFISSCEILGHV